MAHKSHMICPLSPSWPFLLPCPSLSALLHPHWPPCCPRNTPPHQGPYSSCRSGTFFSRDHLLGLPSSFGLTSPFRQGPPFPSCWILSMVLFCSSLPFAAVPPTDPPFQLSTTYVFIMSVVCSPTSLQERELWRAGSFVCLVPCCLSDPPFPPAWDSACRCWGPRDTSWFQVALISYLAFTCTWFYTCQCGDHVLPMEALEVTGSENFACLLLHMKALLKAQLFLF